MASILDQFYVSSGGILYGPEDWYDRQGYYRTPDSFILTKIIRASDGGVLGTGLKGFKCPLNTVNLEDIFAKLPECPPDHPVAQRICKRAYDLKVRERLLRGAERMKLDVGMATTTTTVTRDVERFLFTDDEGNGYGPSVPISEDVEEESSVKVLSEFDAYSPPGRSFYYQQRAAMALAGELDSFLAAMEQRTGKTGPFVTAARIKAEEGKTKLTLIVSTRRLLYTAWTDELVMYWPKSTATILDSKAKREDFCANHYDVAMTSFESLYVNWPMIRELYDPSQICLIADETIKIKSPTARRSVAMFAACSEVKYRYLLSGAPVSRLHTDLLPQLLCVDPGLFGDDYTVAMDYFFYFDRSGAMRFRRGRKTLFHTLTDLGVWRCTRGEAEQFKGRETSTINVNLGFDPLQAQLYTDLAKYMFAMLEDETVSASVQASNILVKLGRLREICGGFLSYEYAPSTYERIRLPNNPKIDWLKDYFTDNDGSRAVIFMEFNEEEAMIGDLLDSMGIKWGGMLSVKRERKKGIRIGSIDEQFADQMREFQEGTLQVFVGKHSSIGHGLTLNTAEVEIFYALGFNSDNYDQARMRAVGGDTGHVLVYHLMMGGSIEETKIYRALSKRQDMKAAVLKDLGRSGYSSFFREISDAQLLVDPKYRESHIDDMLETKARKILGYDGPLEEQSLKEFMTSLGHGLFAQIKESIGSMSSLKSAFKTIALNFHPDRAIGLGHAKNSDTYLLYKNIFLQAVEAREKSYSLGEFVSRIGGKEIEPEHQMWYDYLLRKASGIRLSQRLERDRQIA